MNGREKQSLIACVLMFLMLVSCAPAGEVPGAEETPGNANGRMMISITASVMALPGSLKPGMLNKEQSLSRHALLLSRGKSSFAGSIGADPGL